MANGGIIGPVNTVTGSPKTAPGVWSVNRVYDLVKQGCWSDFNPSFASAVG